MAEPTSFRAADIRKSLLDGATIAEVRSFLSAAGEPSAEQEADRPLVGNIVAALATTVIEVVNCISVTLILKGKWPDSLFDPIFRHVMVGFILTQLATSAFTKFPAAISSVAFENLAILATLRDSITESMKGKHPNAQLVTFLACIAVSLLFSSIFLATASIPQMGKILGLLPNDVRHGVFMAIGIAVFMLGFDSFDLKPFTLDTWASGVNLLKWCPAYALGLGLWFVAENFPSRFLLIGFIGAVIVGMKLILFLVSMSPEEQVDGGWLLAKADPRPFTDFFQLTYGSLGLVDSSVIIENLPLIITAAFVGPVMNVSINVLVLNGMLGPINNLSYSTEFLAQSLGSLLSCFGFGFSSYLTVSDTALMLKAGGTTVQPVLIMVFLMCLVCVIPPILEFLLQTIPVLLPASIFVYIGVDIVLGCLGDMQELAPKEHAFSLLTCFICTYSSLPVGLLGACAVCAFQHFTRKLPEGQNENIQNVMTPALDSLAISDQASKVREVEVNDVQLSSSFNRN